MSFPLRRAVSQAGLPVILVFTAAIAISAQQAPVLEKTGAGDSAAADAQAAVRPPVQDTVPIPGPLRSFLRMAGISQEISPDEVLPMLARNVFLHGYENGRSTEFLILIDRYLHQARELQSIAGNGEIHVTGCADAEQLIRILGYKFQHGCSRRDASLITEDAERSFLTVDSGFPLTELEQSLQEGKPFVYPYTATEVPVLFRQKDWIAISNWKQRPGENLLDVLLHDQAVGRLYSAMSRLEPRTRSDLERSPGLKKLLPMAASFDFYGAQICIPGHAVAVPGDEPAEHAWQELAGASPRSPGEFVQHLLSRDRGWLAAYFDALSRLSSDQQAHIVQGGRLHDLYDAYRSSSAGVAAYSGVFPRNAELLLLLSRISWEADGQPMVPGSLKVWQDVFAKQARTYGYREWVRWAHEVQTPEKFLEALVAATNMATETGPVQMYLMISAIDRQRGAGHRMSEDTVRQIAERYGEFQNWYLIFSDFPQLDDSCIHLFVNTADHINGIPGSALRANALGAFQADIGLWEIFARQREIPAGMLASSWQKALAPFAPASNSTQIFDAARSSLDAIVEAAGGGSSPSQDEIVDLLAGPRQNTQDGARVHEELVRRIQAVLDDQRLVSLDTLFGLYDGLGEMAHGADIGDSLLPLAASLHEFEMPRPIFTGGERVAWSPLIYTSRHAELQVQTDLTKVIRTSHSPEQLDAARARLTPFLRDSLVGLNYAYYEPPGAQVLHNNPLFVRSHDFSVSSVQGIEQVWGAPELIGIGATAGGGAYLMGSLADLPYALASAEEDFIAPEKVQALIWRETVPQLLVGAVLPRWWNIDSNELHAAALYQRSGEELAADAETDPQVRENVLGIFSGRFTTERLEKLEDALEHGEKRAAPIAHLLPSDLFYLAAQFRKQYPQDAAKAGPASRELDELARKDPADTDPARLAADFGVPHPTLAATDSCMLLNREPFPVSGGYSSRLFGESWESSNLYWARIADEMGYSPVMLNLLVPELTHHMIANIFATYVDDWPALLRALEQTGDEFKQGKFSVQSAKLAGGSGGAGNGGGFE
ncbi:MAG TPA: hypothetical protein VKU93_02400 [Terracidiphilus sp.]|nr:hypothetical protein [Terracidiphilus sp.]